MDNKPGYFTRAARAFANLGSTLAGNPVPMGFPFIDPRETVLRATQAQMTQALTFVDPSRLIAAKLFRPYNPSVLVTRKGLNVFDAMKQDEQVKACLMFRKHALLAPGWSIVSPADKPEDWEVTKFVRDCLEHLPGGMDRALRKILLGIDYGYSITEKVYGPGEGELEGKVVLKSLNSAKPHYFDFEVDPHGKILGLLQRYVPGQQTQILLPPNKFIIYSHDTEFENAYGRSELEAVYRAWWVKDNAYKWLATLLERYGMPPLFLFYNPNDYQASDVSALKNIVKNIQNATLGVIPRSSKEGLEFWSANLTGNAKDVFVGAMSRFDEDIAKGLLQPSMIGFSTEGGGGVGSMARSNVHWKAFLFVVEATQRDVSMNAINDQLIPQLCDLNFPNLKTYPKFQFGRLDDKAEFQLFTTWDTLVKGKIVNRIPDDETHIRKSLGFPENDNPVIEALTPPPAPFGAPEAPADPDQKKPAPGAEQKPAPKVEVDKPKVDGEKEKTFEQKLDAETYAIKPKEINKRLDDLEDASAVQLRTVFIKQQTSINATIAKSKDLHKLVKSFKLPFRGELRDAVSGMMRSAWKAGQTDARNEIGVARKMADGSFTPRAAMQWLMDREFWVSGMIGDNITNDVRGAIVNGMKSGKRAAEIMAAISEAMLQYIGNPDIIKDDKQLSAHRLETIVRTNTTEAYNHARLTTFVDPDVVDMLIGVQYSAIIDERTTPVCEFLDGKIFLPDSAELEMLLPPNHFNCRSIVSGKVVGQTVAAEDFITAEQIGKAKQLADASFLSYQGAFRHYRELQAQEPPILEITKTGEGEYRVERVREEELPPPILDEEPAPIVKAEAPPAPAPIVIVIPKSGGGSRSVTGPDGKVYTIKDSE